VPHGSGLGGRVAGSRAATGTATFATGFAGFSGVELMGFATGMGRLAAQAGDFFLALWIHGGKAAFGSGFLAGVVSCHEELLGEKGLRLKGRFSLKKKPGQARQ
jgi:hypothetical protein